MLVASAAAFRAPENPAAIKAPVLTKTPTVVTAPVFEEEYGVISNEKLAQVGKDLASQRFVRSRHATERKQWGVDNDEDASDVEYWFDSRIHTFGNTGFLGALHAAMAPLSTKVIDMVAYAGHDVRAEVAKQLSKTVRSSKANVLDMCCGVGISTRALREAFPESEMVVGMDTSPEMITMANFLTNHLGFFKPIAKFFAQLKQIRFSNKAFKNTRTFCRPTFSMGNAEQTEMPEHSFDLVTIMYAFHEAPKEGRDRILQEAYRILQPGGTLAVVDISTDYTPSDTMLAGEPYVLEYQKNIHRQLKSMRGFSKVRYEDIVPNHVGMWTLKRSTLEL
ncbi:MAG: hypothetical protein SGARI_001866 [Bacillariaceae sp.]